MDCNQAMVIFTKLTEERSRFAEQSANLSDAQVRKELADLKKEIRDKINALEEFARIDMKKHMGWLTKQLKLNINYDVDDNGEVDLSANRDTFDQVIKLMADSRSRVKKVRLNQIFRNVTKKDERLGHFCNQVLKRNDKIESLDLSGNDFRCYQLRRILNAINKNTDSAISELDFLANDIREYCYNNSDDDMTPVIEYLQKIKSIKSVDLRANRLSDGEKERFRDIFKVRPDLTILL